MNLVYVVDDDPNLLKVLSATLREGGYDVRGFGAAAEAARAVAGAAPDALVSDLAMPGEDGIALLRRVRETAPGVPVILLTAHGTIDRAVEAMKAGAYDFLTKPIEGERLLVVVRNAVDHGRLASEVGRLRRRVREDLGATIVGASAAIRRVLDLVERVAPEETTVLVTGETGTGKELVARAIHASSPRAAGPFIVADCGAIPETLVESELFGHLRGAFTGALRDRKGRFEAASGGTLFLDEVGEIPLALQSRLLRALDDRSVTPVGASREVRVDVRFVAATNRDLKADVAAGRFREDLFWRLHVFPVEVPPLRLRKEDVPLLVAHLLRRHDEDPPEVSPEALRLLAAHDWPGNVRELDHVLERAAVLAGDAQILPEHLPSLGAGGGATETRTPLEVEIPDDGIDLEALERRLIVRALEKTGGNRTRAARLLGITRSALLYRMEKHGLR